MSVPVEVEPVQSRDVDVSVGRLTARLTVERSYLMKRQGKKLVLTVTSRKCGMCCRRLTRAKHTAMTISVRAAQSWCLPKDERAHR